MTTSCCQIRRSKCAITCCTITRKMSKLMPENIQSQLPTIEDIEATLSDIKETKDFKKGNDMKNKDNIPQFVNSDSFMADKNYVKWLSDLKKHFRMAQLKAAVKVNTEMLKFYWSLGEDICEKQKQDKWGAKVVDRLSLDMRSEIPQSEGFSRPLPCKTLVCVLFKSNRNCLPSW